MVHAKFSENLIQKVMIPIPFVNVVTVPFELSTKNPATFIPELHSILEINNISLEKIEYILVEANYGAPSGSAINKTLIDHLITTFPAARIALHSGTTACLANSLAYNLNSRYLEVVGKGTGIDTELSGYLGRPLTEDEAERVFTIAQFRDSIKTQHVNMARNRTLSDPQILAPSIENRVRSPSLPTFTPMYSATPSNTEQVSNPNSGSSSTETLSKNVSGFRFS